MIKLILISIILALSFTSCGESKKDRIQRLVNERLNGERLKLIQM